jgi:hypothetical protein
MRNKTIIKIERRIIKVKYFIRGLSAKRKLGEAHKKGVLPKNSIQLYKDLARANMDIKGGQNA